MPGLGPGIHEFLRRHVQVADIRDKPGHDDMTAAQTQPGLKPDAFTAGVQAS